MTTDNKQKNISTKLKIGNLVFIKTHNAFSGHGNNWATQTTGKITLPSYQRSISHRTVTVPYVEPQTNTGGWYVESLDIDNHSYDYSEVIDTTGKFSSEEINSLKQLYDAYLNQSSGKGRGNSGNLGMSTWNRPPAFSSSNNWKITTGTANATISPTTFGGTAIISTSLPTQLDVSFYAHGFEKIEDYFKGRVKPVEQKEGFTEKEIESLNKTKNLSLTWGKPFKGIIVDVFSPKLKTVTGEEVNLDVTKMPTLYKVLIDENNCLWFNADDVYEMTDEE